MPPVGPVNADGYYNRKIQLIRMAEVRDESGHFRRGRRQAAGGEMTIGTEEEGSTQREVLEPGKEGDEANGYVSEKRKCSAGKISRISFIMGEVEDEKAGAGEAAQANLGKMSIQPGGK